MEKVENLYDSLKKGNRVALSKAITLLESKNPSHQEEAEYLLSQLVSREEIIPRIAITGPPGVGKSSLIEALGLYVIEHGYHPAVLTIDPTSRLTKGSILGDRTRMEELSKKDEAFIRQTPSSSKLGGVAPNTRETILLCEQAGYDIIFIETVGVGQSEFEVTDISDLMVLLVLPGSGDELQGVKKGITEVADIFVVNKADGNQLDIAKNTERQVRNAIQITKNKHQQILRPVHLLSTITKKGIPDIWNSILKTIEQLKTLDLLKNERKRQQKMWFTELIRQRWMKKLEQNINFKNRFIKYDDSVSDINSMIDLVKDLIKATEK